jgi:hypothetical protein
LRIPTVFMFGRVTSLPAMRRRCDARAVSTGLTGALCAWVAGWSAFALGLLLAAWRHRPETPAPAELELVVLVPAHDEESSLPETLASLTAAAAAHPARILVIADNCSDATASVARAAGAEVWERDEPALRGKGHALRWALDRLMAGEDWQAVDAVAMIDADCAIDRHGLGSMAAHLAGGSAAIQSDYVVANPESSSATALRASAFRLTNTVRPRGKEQLGLSVGLGGTGMAFRREVLERVPWAASSVTEDAEYHVRLVEAGIRVAFAGDVEVSSRMPTRAAAIRQQEMRWEAGFVGLARRFTGRLVLRGLRRRDPVAVVAGLDLAAPPQSLLAVQQLVALAMAAAVGSRRLAALAVASLLGQAAFVIGGLALVRAPAAAWRGLARAPLVMAGKVGMYARLVTGRGPKEFVRTERS